MLRYKSKKRPNAKSMRSPRLGRDLCLRRRIRLGRGRSFERVKA